MNDITIFNNQQFGEIRVVERDGNPWFVAADVCRSLELTNSRMATERLYDDEKGVSSIDTPGGIQEMTVVSEPGLYALVLGSRKPEAVAFQRWITHEVIPSIRKHGAYALDNVLDQIIADPEFGLRLITALKEEREKNAALQPKADYFDALVDRNLLTGVRQTAKELKVKPKQFVQELIDGKYVYRDQKGNLQPYAEHVTAGLFSLKECKSARNGWSGTQVLVTPKGRETFRLLFAA